MNPLRTHIHHKQILLFMVAVLLPSSVLIVLTWRMMSQQEELHEKRLADERARIAREVGQNLLVHLEEIKLREVSTTAGTTYSLNRLAYTSPEVILIGSADRDRLLLPWEVPQAGDRRGQSRRDVVFLEKIHRAEEYEFVGRQFAQAQALYLECIEEAWQPREQAHARLSRARVLAKSGEPGASTAEYLKILDMGCETVDEHGVPFCLYAASRLVATGTMPDQVLPLVDRVLKGPHWLSPETSYLLRDLLDVVLNSGAEPGPWRQVAEEYQQRVLKRIGRQEAALAVQKEFPKLAFMAQWNSPEEKSGSIWVPCGDEPMLVGLAPVSPGKQRLAIVVRAHDILASVAARTPSLAPFLTDVRVITAEGSEGESLGPNFPGLRVVSAMGGQISPQDDWSVQRSFYLIALFLVLCATAFGAHSVWRDVGRELRTAEMRSHFIASVSHELKTPLTAIRVLAETLRLGRCEGRQKEAEYVDAIVNESHRLTRLLNNVLDFSKIEKGKRVYHKEPADLADIIRSAAQATRYPLMQQDFHLKVSVAEDLPVVRVDRDAVEQAILNLLSNAMKYSGEAKEIGLRAYRRDNYAVIEVTDGGMGIPAGEHQRIFERFYRVPSKENERVPGTGLGLALAGHVVEAHNGHIEVQSAPGQGSTFSVYLPLENTP